MCIAVLEDLYGVPSAEEIDPVDLLVSTMLSQNTSDFNSLRAFASMKSAYPNYESLLRAPVEEVAGKIRVGGLSGIKAQRIKEALGRIKMDAGSIDLDFLQEMGKEEAQDYLLSLSGVGPKTAAVVLLFAFRLPALPVDTHVYRVSRRIGLAPEDASIEEAQRVLERVTPPEKYISLHLNLIRHGRRVCRARDPIHKGCALRYLCDCYLRATSLK
jgi:endonuclease-3